MILQEFIAKYNGAGGVGNTADNKGQCTGVVNVWLKDQGLSHVWGHAFNFLVNADPEAYAVIKNTPDAVPESGDVIVWTKGFNGTYGHTAIVVKGNVKTFEVFEQNNPLGSPCRLHTYPDYSYVDGWLRNRAITAQPTAQEFMDQTLIPSLLLTSKDYPVSQALEIQQLRGLLGDYGRLQRDYDGMLAQAHDLKRQLKEAVDAYNRLLTAPDGQNSADYSVSELIAMLLKKIIKLPT